MKSVFLKLGIVFCVILTQNLQAQCKGEQWERVAAGLGYTTVLDNNGSLWTGGINNSGQLGDGTTINRNRLFKVELEETDIKEFAMGHEHTIVIGADASLWAWGANRVGQLGNGSTTNREKPVRVGSRMVNWKQATAGKDFTLAIRVNGTLWGWGKNNKGQLGIGKLSNAQLIPVQVGKASAWKAVSAGLEHALVLKEDGTLWAIGDNSSGELGIGATAPVTEYNQMQQIGTEFQWEMISAGSSGSLAIKKDGTLWGWGSCRYGQLGNGKTTGNEYFPVQIGKDSDWKMICTKNYHSFAIKKDGSLWAFGSNSEGQLGDGTRSSKAEPTQVGKNIKWKDVSVGKGFTVALAESGTLYTWGNNSNGQLVDNSYNNREEIADICKLSGTTPHFNSGKISIYPNPTDNNIMIDFGDLLFGEAKVMVYNNLGQVVLQKNSIASGTLILPLLGDPGCYFVRIDFPDGNIIKQKIVKKNK